MNADRRGWKKWLCARIRRDPHFYWGSAKIRSRSYEPLRLPQLRDHQCLSAFKGESVCTNRAHRKHLVTPAQATHRSRVRRGEEGDRAPTVAGYNDDAATARLFFDGLGQASNALDSRCSMRSQQHTTSLEVRLPASFSDALRRTGICRPDRRTVEFPG